MGCAMKNAQVTLQLYCITMDCEKMQNLMLFIISQMSDLDLNVPLTEDDDVDDMEPQYCTQAVTSELIGKSTDQLFYLPIAAT
jgi:hypothetical protein